MPTGLGLATRDSSPPRARQKYGAACEECRRRKLRCDRRRPQCGVCQASGMQCHVAVSRALRGPKPGYIKDLQARIGESNNFFCFARSIMMDGMQLPVMFIHSLIVQ